MTSALNSTLFVSTLICKKCGSLTTPLVTSATGPHAYRADCGDCGRFIQFVSRYTPEERAARQEAARHAAMSSKPPTVQQLSYLIALGDKQPAPQSMAEASERISALRQAQGVRV